MQKHRICVVGVGNWGLNHVKTLLSMNQAVGCVDGSNKKLKKIKLLFPEIKCYDSINSSFRDEYNGYIVATPSATHKEISISIIKKHKPLLVEKPLSLNLEDAMEIKKNLKLYNGKLIVGHLMLFHPAITKMKSIINDGKIGRIIYLYSNRLNFGKIRKKENVLWSFAPHDISLFQYFINSFPKNVSSEGTSILQKGIYDSVITSLEYPKKIRGHIYNSWINPFKEHKIVIIGTKGSLTYEDSAGDKSLYYFRNRLEQKKLENISNNNINKEKIKYKLTSPLENELKYFIRILEGNPVDIAGINEAVDVVKVLEIASNSLSSSKKK